MDPAAPKRPGFLGSFRALGDGLLASVQDRLELFALELQEEKFRLIRTFFWISAVIFAAMMTLAFASLTLVYLFWESARLAVLGGLTLLYAGALVAIILAFRRYLARQPTPFAATLHELGGRPRMYPNQELIRLAAHKAALQRDIAVHRAQCMAAVAQLAQPLAWLDRALAFWRKLSPFATLAAVPLGFLAQRTLFPRLKILRSLLRWVPVVVGAARGVSSAIKSRAGSS